MNVQFFQEARCQKDAIRLPECSWTIEFESLLCAICAGFIRDLDPAMEACRIAKRSGDRFGAMFLVRRGDQVAKLCMLIRIRKINNGK